MFEVTESHKKVSWEARLEVTVDDIITMLKREFPGVTYDRLLIKG